MNAFIIISLLVIAGYCFYRAGIYNQKKDKENIKNVVEPTIPDADLSCSTYHPTTTIEDIRLNSYPQRAYSYLAGLKYEGRQAKLKKFAEQEAIYQDKYQGLTGKELKEQLEFDIVWEYDLFEVDIELEHESDNKHDSNAIAVYVTIDDEEIKVGYIPKVDNEYFLEIMENSSWVAYGTIKGGKFKELDWDERVKTHTRNYSMDITLWYDRYK